MQESVTLSEDESFELPAEVLGSRLYGEGGYLFLRGWILDDIVQRLLAEADALRATALRHLVLQSDGVEGRGGKPARAFFSSQGRGFHWRLYSSTQLIKALERVCELTLEPTGSGTYSYYENPGDFLGLHRDVMKCDVTVITCLCSDNTTDAPGELLVYPKHIHKSLASVRAAGKKAGVSVPLVRGDTVALLGGTLPHEVTPLTGMQRRIVAISCYRILSS